MEQSELARRVTFAFYALNQREIPKRVTQSELGLRVGRRVSDTFTQTSVAGWLAGKVPRDLDTMEALADELGVDPGWLYFNRGEAPVGWIGEPHVTRVAKDDLEPRGIRRAAAKKRGAR